MRIQHNILAMNAYRNYNTNTSALAKNLEKLSSGYKINRAGDDAAGLAISEKMRAQITGLNAASKNVKDGISLVKTAEGAMQEIQDMLNRMDYLATQSANGTYDNEVDRLNLNKEMDALKTEIDRIAASANFNGIKLLDGSLVDATGVPASTEETKIQVDTSTACGQFHKAGLAAQTASFQVDLKQAIHGAKVTGSFGTTNKISIKVNVGGQTVTASFIVKGSVASQGVIKASNVTFNANATLATIAFKAGNGSVSFKVSLGSDGVLKFTATKAVDFDANMAVSIRASGGATISVGSTANIGGNDTAPVSYNCMTQNVKNGVAATGDQLAHGHFELTADMIKEFSKGGKLTIGLDTDTKQSVITFNTKAKGSQTTTDMVGVADLLDDDGNIKTDDKTIAELVRRISVAAASNSAFTVGAGSDGKTITLEEKFDYYDATKKDETWIKDQEAFNKRVTYTTSTAAGKDGGLVLQIGDTSDDFNRLIVNVGDMHVDAMGVVDEKTGKVTGQTIAEIDIKTPEAAKEAIDVIKGAINYVSGVRGDLGAVQNRLEHTANNLSVMAENIQDAESTIRDTDIAEEMMSYTKNNILVQSAQAMLAQANAVPQGVLQLLG